MSAAALMRLARRLVAGRAALVAPIVVLLSISATTALVNLRAMGAATDDAEVQNVAARQAALLDRYAREVFLALDGHPGADPEGVAEELRRNADALLAGGTVSGFQGSGHEQVEVSAVEQRELRLKLAQSRRLLAGVFATAARLLDTPPAGARRSDLLDRFRVETAAVSSNLKDASGSLTASVVERADRLVVRQLALGIAALVTTIVTAAVFFDYAARRRDRRHQAMIERASDLILITDDAGVVRFASNAAARVIGVAPGQLVGTSLLRWLDEGDHLVVLEALRSKRSAQAVFVEHRLRRPDGSRVTVESSFTNMLDVPAVRGFVVNARDVTDRKRLEEELHRQAFEDSLTGLPNRALLLDRVDHANRRALRTGETIALLFVDLDGFKLVNDSYGHPVGDLLLVEIADRLRCCVRDGDTIARLGGDEFAVLLEGLRAPEEAHEAAARVVAALAEPILLSGVRALATASVGVAVTDSGARTAMELLGDADVAMYRAKAEGRSRYVVFEASMHADAVEFQLLATEMREALAGDDFSLAYQPIFDPATGAVAAVEALLRWESPTMGPVSPARFVPVAERCGLVEGLGAWVLRTACAEAVGWPPSAPLGRPPSVNVNVSVLQLHDRSFVDTVQAVLDESGLEPSRLTLELTESVFAHEQSVLGQLEALRRMQVRIAVDDFGTGYSSLGNLARLPVDVVKIDKAFVDAIDRPEGMAMVRSIFEMVASLGLQATAEGVETEDQLRRLLTCECQSVQGFVYSRPLGVPELRTLLLGRPLVGLPRVGEAAGGGRSRP